MRSRAAVDRGDVRGRERAVDAGLIEAFDHGLRCCAQVEVRLANVSTRGVWLAVILEHVDHEDDGLVLVVGAFGTAADQAECRRQVPLAIALAAHFDGERPLQEPDCRRMAPADRPIVNERVQRLSRSVLELHAPEELLCGAHRQARPLGQLRSCHAALPDA